MNFEGGRLQLKLGHSPIFQMIEVLKEGLVHTYMSIFLKCSFFLMRLGLSSTRKLCFRLLKTDLFENSF